MLKFHDMPYVRPDVTEVRACYERVTEKILHAASYEEARAAFFELQDAENETGTMMSLAHTRNTIDTADAYYEGEVRYMQAEFARMMPLQ